MIFPGVRSAAVFCDDILPKGSSVDLYVGQKAYGGKIIFSGAEFRLYESTESDAFNYGFCWHTEKIMKSLPWVIKAGNLTPGGLYSKMKNPLLSSSLSPFSSVPSEATWLTATLPSYSSFSSSSSYYLQCGYSNAKAVLQELLISYWSSQAEDIQALSAKIKFCPVKKLNVALSGCSGYFDFETDYNNSWFSDDLFYHNGTHFCGITQLSVSLPAFSSLFTLGLFESPFGSFKNLYKLESKYKSSHFIFSFAGLYIPQQLITSSDITEKEMLQLKTGLQYKFITGTRQPVCVKTGIATVCKINLSEEEHNLKAATGIQISAPVTSLAATALVNTNVTVPQAGTSQLHFKSCELKLSNTWYFQSFCPTIACSQSFTPATDFSTLTTVSSYEFNYNFTGNPKVSDKYKFSVTKKNNVITKKSFSNTISLKTKIKRVSVTGAFSMSMEF